MYIDLHEALWSTLKEGTPNTSLFRRLIQWCKLLFENRQLGSEIVHPDVSPAHPTFTVEGRTAVENPLVVNNWQRFFENGPQM